MTSKSVPVTSSRRELLTASAALLAGGLGGVAQVHAQAITQAPLPRRPEDVHPYFSRTFNAGDIDAAMRMYVQDAVFVPKPGSSVRGLDAIRAALAEFMQLKLPIKTTHKQALVSGDVALLISEGHPVHVVVHHGGRHDLGNPGGFVRATVDFALDHPEYGPSLREWLIERIGTTD